MGKPGKKHHRETPPVSFQRLTAFWGRAVRKRYGVWAGSEVAKGHSERTSGRSILRNAPLRATSSVLRGSRLRAIPKTLSNCISKTIRRVGFALNWKTLRLMLLSAVELAAAFHTGRGISCLCADSQGHRPDSRRREFNVKVGETVSFPI